MARTVVDLGCYDHGGTCDSLAELTAKYQPSRVYGFDPHPELKEATFATAGTSYVVRRRAAWLYDGEVSFFPNGTGSRLGGDLSVPCFDFSAWLAKLKGDIVLKMDVEGSEYGLLDRMRRDGTDRLVSELLVEWHGPPAETELACPVREWWM